MSLSHTAASTWCSTGNAFKPNQGGYAGLPLYGFEVKQTTGPTWRSYLGRHLLKRNVWRNPKRTFQAAVIPSPIIGNPRDSPLSQVLRLESVSAPEQRRLVRPRHDSRLYWWPLPWLTSAHDALLPPTSAAFHACIVLHTRDVDLRRRHRNSRWRRLYIGLYGN